MSDPARPVPEQYASARSETFDVVLCRKGVVALDGKVEDFRRVTVSASEPYTAMQHADVEKAVAEEPGWVVLQAVPQGGLQEHEANARNRAATAALGTFDPTKV